MEIYSDSSRYTFVLSACAVWHTSPSHTPHIAIAINWKDVDIYMCVYKKKKTHTHRVALHRFKEKLILSLSQIFVEHQKLVYYYSSVINIWVAMPKHHVVFVRMK